MKKLLLIIGAAVLLLVLVVLIKTVTFTSETFDVASVTPVDVPDAALERFQKAIQYKTISFGYPATPDSAEFYGFHNFLAEAFPLIDSLLEKNVIAGYSLLYKWQGTDASTKPVILMSHMDVVPVDEGTLTNWEAPPFSGEIKNGFIYGRGTMDDKIGVMSILEAVEMSLKDGLQPKRTIYLAFGHDEEVGGEQGAGAIGRYMEEQGIKAEFVVDEGGYVSDGMVPGVSKPLAVINVAEKGFISYELTITTPGGHSSMPPKNNTIGSLAAAIVKLEANQFPYKMTPTLQEQINIVGPEMPFIQKMAFANTWLLGGKILEGLNAHTTTAPTIIKGGVKDNVIPTSATAVVNFRVMPGETTQEVLEHIIEVVADDRITVKPVSSINEPSVVADHRSPSYQLIAKTVKQLMPGTIVTPGLLGGGTDTKHYRNVSENQYRFFPIRLSPDNATGFHGINEHLAVDNYKEVVQFFHQLIKNMNE
ncbi:MAG: M20 family peptidase [Imperialibacter sp.]|uniref:M20 family peptidase n=1 Tax=Imperialibacter sp. TaxID=2038411 RepID=UPI0032ECC815